MADVVSTLRGWSATAASNLPVGTTTIGTNLDDNLRELQAVVRKYLASVASNMASATTVDLSTADGYYVQITGTTTITGFGTESAGIQYLLRFAGALTLTYNATSMILPSGASITTAAGDMALMISEGSGNWRCVSYQRAKLLDQFLDVRNYGATGDGSTDDATAIQAAVTAAAGKTLYFPLPSASYKISSNITKPAAGISVIVDTGVLFTGAGRMFAIDGNTFHDYTGTTFSQVRSDVGVAGRGYAGLSSEFIATAAFLGNGCGAFFSAKTPNGAAGFYWGINPILELNPGLTGNGIACEVDLNNYTAAGKGQGVLVTGVGTFSSQVGVAIERADLTSDWQFGSIIKNSQVGLRIDGTSVVSPTGGVQVIGYANNLVKLVPLNDTTPSDAAIYLSNAAESVVHWKVTKRGGVQIGIGGAEIQKYLSASAVLNFGSVAANTTSELTVTVTGAVTGDLCLASPDLSLTAGFSWSAFCIAADTVRIRLTNATTGALDPDGGGPGATWRVSVIKH